MGYLPQDLLGLNLKDFIHEDDQSKINDTWNRMCRDRQIVTSGHYRFRTSDNSYVILQTIFEPFVNPWNDEIEIIVTRNKVKAKSSQARTSTSNKNDNQQNNDEQSPSRLNSSELLRQLLP